MTFKPKSRREFLKLTAASAFGAGVAPNFITASSASAGQRSENSSSEDTIRFATIGTGGMGFGDTSAALDAGSSTFVAAADCYEGRLKRIQEVHGKDVATTMDYREILNRNDIDAVIIATPDHWHAQITTDALNAGKHVYCEKPMVQDLEEGRQVIQTEQKTGNVVQVGSQGISSILDKKARDLFRQGAIGQLSMVEASISRNSAVGAWQYSIPPDASPRTIDWKQFLGDAPKRPFDARRFFRWRNYWDYGTGIPGDLFVHLHTAIHYILDSKGPDRVMSTGGLRYWKDGRDVPDVMAGLYNYPETDAHPGFTLSLKVNFADGSENSGSGFRFIGDEGVMTLGGNKLTLTKIPPRGAPGYTIGTFPEETREEFMEAYREHYPEPDSVSLSQDSETVYETPDGYSARVEHFKDFFNAIRTGSKVIEDSTVGFRAAAPALLANVSYREDRVCKWDPVKMTMKS